MEEVKAYNLQVPFPQRLNKAKLKEQFSRFLNMFKKIEINILFSKNLNQMPHYVKFIKDILSKKSKIVEGGVVSLTATYSAVIQKSLLEKMQDPSSFTIPCKIGNYDMGKALQFWCQHQLYAFICGSKTLFGGAYSHNHDPADGRHNFG